MAFSPTVADVLGLVAPGKKLAPLDLLDRLEQGLPLNSLNRLAKEIAPSDVDFVYLIVSRSTLSRRRQQPQQRLSTDESERLARLARIWLQAKSVWGDEPRARDFLREPHMLLRGRSPAEVALKTDEGARLVEDILGRLKYGTAA